MCSRSFPLRPIDKELLVSAAAGCLGLQFVLLLQGAEGVIVSVAVAVAVVDLQLTFWRFRYGDAKKGMLSFLLGTRNSAVLSRLLGGGDSKALRLGADVPA
jgi:hypothetical protein